jgi:hypothetical protein
LQDEHEHDDKEDDDGDLLRTGDRVGDGCVRCDRKRVAGIRTEEPARELASEGDCVRGDDRDLGRPGPRAPFREGKHHLKQEDRPEPREQQAQCPQRLRARPLDIRSEESEACRCEQPPRSTPPWPLDRDDRGRHESPRKREVRRDPRPRHSLVDTEPADCEAGRDDRRDEQHRIADQVSAWRGGRVGRHHSSSAANVAAVSLDFGMSPRAPHDTTRAP